MTYPHDTTFCATYLGDPEFRRRMPGFDGARMLCSLSALSSIDVTGADPGQVDRVVAAIDRGDPLPALPLEVADGATVPALSSALVSFGSLSRVAPAAILSGYRDRSVDPVLVRVFFPTVSTALWRRVLSGMRGVAQWWTT